MPLYTSDEMAALLEMHPQTLKYHRNESKYLAGFGALKGRSIVYTEDDLKAMRKIVANMPPPGRKRKPEKKKAKRPRK
jgi:hypothetical protein